MCNERNCLRHLVLLKNHIGVLDSELNTCCQVFVDCFNRHLLDPSLSFTDRGTTQDKHASFNISLNLKCSSVSAHTARLEDFTGHCGLIMVL